MAADSFANDGLGWQVQQLQRRGLEWFEYWLTDDPPDIPLGDLPPIPGWVVRLLLWVALAATASWIIVVLLRTLLPELRQWLARERVDVRAAERGQPTLKAAEWWRRAQQFQQQGDYREACRALYFAMLERLHETQQILHQDSRTDGEYRDRVGQLPQPQPYQELLEVHEQLCFGNAAISADTWQRCERAYRTIDEVR